MGRRRGRPTQRRRNAARPFSRERFTPARPKGMSKASALQWLDAHATVGGDPSFPEALSEHSGGPRRPQVWRDGVNTRPFH